MAKTKDAWHVMVDLETFALSEKAVIISMAFVLYDSMWNERDFISLNLDTNIQKQLGREIDPNTLAWWEKQPKNIYDEVTRDPQDVATSIERAFAMVEVATKANKVKTVLWWGNSAIFDLLKINSLIRDLAGTAKNADLNRFLIDEYFMRCFKSVRDVSEDYMGLPYPRKEITHRAIDDARTQGKYMRKLQQLKSYVVLT